MWKGGVLIAVESAHDGLADFLFEQAFDFFEAFVAASGARFFEVQTSDVVLSVMLHTYGSDLVSEKIVFRDELTTSLPVQEAALDFIEATLPSFPCHTLWIAGLGADRRYDLELVGSNLASGDAPAPGVPLRSLGVRANKHGVAQIRSGPSLFQAGSRMRLRGL